MILIENLDLLMFIFLCGFLLLGFPVAFTLGGTALLFAFIGAFLGVFDLSFVAFLKDRIFGIMMNQVLIAVPLFIFMGVVLERSKIAEDLLETMGSLFGKLRGGLGISVFFVGALLAASTGIVGATVVTMGLLSLPCMIKRGYEPSLACGTICAAGTLGQIIPPSIVLVLLGDQISNAYQEAARVKQEVMWEQGVFDYENIMEPVSVGHLFAGALVPGLMLVLLYIIYIVFMAWLRPQHLPAIQISSQKKKIGDICKVLIPPILLIFLVLGSILMGVAPPTEAASIGAVGAIFLAALRLGTNKQKQWVYCGLIGVMFLCVWQLYFMKILVLPSYFGHFFLISLLVLFIGGLMLSLFILYRKGLLSYILETTMKTSSMVFMILIGAALFSLVFRGYGGDETIDHFLQNLPGGAMTAFIATMVLMFVLGFFLDFIEITFVVVPIVAPLLLMMDIHPIWLGVMMAMNLQTSFLTPPFGFSLFYLRGVAPLTITTVQIYKGAIPFVVIQLFALVVLAVFPQLITTLPDYIYQ